MKPQVVCLPGGVAPAAQRYAPLVAGVGDSADIHLKDLEVYSDAVPPADYSVEMELAGVDRFADSRGLSRFHLVGYSGGGFISLAYAGTRPRRVLSVGLFEPAGLPGDMTAAELTVWLGLKEKLRGLKGGEFMSAFVREQLKPGVQPPQPPGKPAPGMESRPAGIAAMIQAFDAFQFDRERLRKSAAPMFLGYGDLTHDVEATRAGILAGLIADIRIQRFGGIHHFVAPELIYTAAHVAALQELWLRRDAGSPLPA
jgi:pimeloyl-ACP methyl ester carboxylesterase